MVGAVAASGGAGTRRGLNGATPSMPGVHAWAHRVSILLESLLES